MMDPNPLISAPLDLILRAATALGSVVAAVSLIYTAKTVVNASRQYRLNLDGRRKDDLLKIVASMSAHNSPILEDKHQWTRKAISKLEGLRSFPTTGEPTEEEKYYWATRLLHLGHVALVWQVWELSDRKPGAGERLEPTLDGWDRFAEKIIAKQLRDAHTAVNVRHSEDPADLAGADLLHGLRDYEILPTKFVEWLMSLPPD